jgi:hypothetical protein
MFDFEKLAQLTYSFFFWITSILSPETYSGLQQAMDDSNKYAFELVSGNVGNPVVLSSCISWTISTSTLLASAVEDCFLAQRAAQLSPTFPHHQASTPVQHSAYFSSF